MPFNNNIKGGMHNNKNKQRRRDEGGDSGFERPDYRPARPNSYLMESAALPFSCFRHDISASLVGNSQFLSAATSRPTEYSFKKLQNLIQSMERFRGAIFGMQSASNDIINSLEEVGDAVPLSDIYSKDLVMVLDHLVHLNTCISNIHETLGGEMDTKVLAPLKDISQAIPLLASTSSRSRNTKRHSFSGSRKSIALARNGI